MPQNPSLAMPTLPAPIFLISRRADLGVAALRGFSTSNSNEPSAFPCLISRQQGSPLVTYPKRENRASYPLSSTHLPSRYRNPSGGLASSKPRFRINSA